MPTTGFYWLLHAPTRAKDTETEERTMFDAFDGPWSRHLHPLFREIGKRLGLDYFGVDCSIDGEGRVLIFEANACMSILLNTSPSPNMWDAPIARIAAALERRLAQPATLVRAAVARARLQSASRTAMMLRDS